MSSPEHLSIKSWSSEDQPREKMLAHGRKHLTNAELIAILIGTGGKNESAVELSKRILSSVDQDLNALGRMDLKSMMKFKGIGEAKAVTIAAALELGRRRQGMEATRKAKITCSKDAYEIIIPALTDLPHEEFWILLLDRSNKVIDKKQISTGGVSGTLVDAKVVFKSALELLASGIILCHNHPSGNLRPSKADLDLTKKLKEAGKTLDINIFDHLIVTDAGYLSFADEGLL